MGFNLAKWFIEGEVDWEFWNKALAAWGPAVAGALFGAVATVAMIMINLLPRRDLMDEGREEGEEFRARLWLFISFLIALGAVAGSVAVLVSASQQKDLASVGVGSVLQCGLILLGSLMFWAFRSGDQGGYGYIS
ncbi:Transmembrane 50A [Micractinium conductrix]|uniref:Transmembrane 50A n=1 Tax=Micractinium conductrix TaxID=554055 RepID=A0A2P6UZ52_9CHLO|nr:Transmembrane 50A [Micractinium conductrix]PSC67119.1 Transmembrane 50A [Micractinium conductrix]PSC67298.1 Transmembrane 50A [Micractinium conductrix]|eukprot:PSC67007.1 Transmembrane 50A [Micractinium conductrix]